MRVDARNLADLGLPKHTFKTPGIARSGFEYQDLVGIEVLLSFYRNPNLYHWVELDSEDTRFGKLDDVVAARQDNSFELLQVKFTADPETYFLDWDWLLAKKVKGTSLLKKWSDALLRVKLLGRLHSAKLRTNRRPNEDIASVLRGSFVEFDKIEPAQRKLVSKEIGGDNAAREFFSLFEFAHSEPLIDDLEAKLKGDIVPTDTDNTGWLLLRQQASRWSTRKKSPEPDGKVRHEHLVQIITKRRPKPIPQDFEIPVSYQVPSQDFHDAFISRIKTSSNAISVLWGTPGRGKSTYLSYLVDLLNKEKLPTIRHHYFLSLDDSTADRISFPEICSSLMDQMSGLHTDAVRGLEDSPNQLRKWLEACGLHYAKEGKKFYLVIDGLDHVWREQLNISQMEHLFNYLLPCPKNVCLLIGTQRVSKQQLPLKLIQNSKEGDWIEVPPMDYNAVHAWLEAQQDAGRLLLRDQQHAGGATELSKVSHAFFEITNGNPLHLIYSFEALVRRGLVVTSDEVELLPSCPDGDIRRYYGGLWGRLPTEAKKVLHLIAGSDFHWPADGLRKCAGSLYEVDHLLEHRRTGLIPFHGSILAYARDQSDHVGAFEAVLPTVVRWLEREAPEYWRWAWLWIMRARSGDSAELLSKTTREWVIDSLAKGWPTHQMVIILRSAEELAFSVGDYNRTIKLRSLKTRILNGQDYQINRFNDFHESAIRATRNGQQILNMVDEIPSSTDDDIVTIVRCLNGKENDGIGLECYEELRRQVNLWISLRHRPDEEFFSLAENFVEALVDFGNPEINNLLKFITQFHASDRIFKTFLRNVVRVRNFELANQMIGLLQSEKDVSWRNATQNAIVRIAAAEEIDLSVRLTAQASISPLLACWFRIKNLAPPEVCSLADLSSKAVRDDYEYGPNIDVEKFFYAFFFSSLEIAFHAIGDCSPALVGIDQSKLGWMAEAIRHLWKTAFELAKQPSQISYGSIFLGLADLEPVNNLHRPSEAPTAQYRGFRNAVRQIASDLHILRHTAGGCDLVSKEAFEIARGSTHWTDESWIAAELEERTVLFEERGVKGLVDELEKAESMRVTQFSERGERWIDLAQISVLYGHSEAQRFVSRAADCIVGYGWRKDVWIFDVLSAVRAVHESSTADVEQWMKQLAPIIDRITDFTDGDETNHAPGEFIDLIALAKPEWLSHLYSQYIASEKWALAEDTLAGILSQVDFTHTVGRALTRTLLEATDLNELTKLEKEGNRGIKAQLARQRTFLGILNADISENPSELKSKLRSGKEDLGRRGKPPDIKKFKPDQLELLLRRVGRNSLGYKHREDALHGWLKYWDKKGEGLKVINAIDAYFNTHENPHEIDILLDEVFDVSLKYEGKSKAYVWLVRAHVERHGWNYYWDDSDRVKRRLELAAQHYKNRWAEFIRDTSKPSRYWEKRQKGLTIGTRWLVHFLLLVKQKKLAVQYVDAMVNITKEELHDQPIQPLEWLH
jgi:NACHT domain